MVYKILTIVCPVLAEILLLLCGAFFASSETAYTSLSRITVRQMLKDKIPKANKVAHLRANLDTLISTVLIGTNFIVSLASSLATAFGKNIFGSKYVPYVTAVMSVLIIIFSEIIPKTLAAVKSKEIACAFSTPLIVLQKILFPLVWLFGNFTKFIEFIEKCIFPKKAPLITEEELKTLIDVGENEGTLEEQERDMLERIFEFSDLKVNDIMRHRSMVKFIDVKSSLNEVVQAFADSGYSRLPIFENDRENIVGVLHYKAVLFANKAITDSKDFVRICMRSVTFVPGTLSAVELLQRFKKEKINFSVVLNEYGGVAGIVTMDDILRGVFGRMTDEYGAADVSPEKQVDVVGINEFIVPGEMRLEDFNDVLELNLDSENFDTIAGWLLEKFGELPTVGAVYKEKGTLFIVEDQSARRIQSIRVKFL